jgi:hypothetical protein
LNNSSLIILGMHRSGTSATAGMLRCLGVELGKKLYAGHAHINAKGYFEHSDIADTNDEALLALNSAWDDILKKSSNWWESEDLEHYAKKIRHYLRRDFSDTTMWAVKDPRICRLLPWWLNILTEEKIKAKFVFVIRPPEEVYLSLKRRNGFSKEKSYLLWLLHYLEAEYWTRGLSRTFVTFDNLVSDPVYEFSKIEHDLNFNFPISPSKAETCLKQFISKDLIHHNTLLLNNDEQSKLVEYAIVLYNELSSLAKGSQNKLDPVNLDKLRSQVEALQQFPPLLVEQLLGINKIRSNLQLTMNKIMRSRSWMMGKPVRFLERLLGKDV